MIPRHYMAPRKRRRNEDRTRRRLPVLSEDEVQALIRPRSGNVSTWPSRPPVRERRDEAK